MLYAIQLGEDGPVKLGCAADPLRRMSQLQTANSRRMRLLGCCHTIGQVDRSDQAWLAIHAVDGAWTIRQTELEAAALLSAEARRLDLTADNLRAGL